MCELKEIVLRDYCRISAIKWPTVIAVYESLPDESLYPVHFCQAKSKWW